MQTECLVKGVDHSSLEVRVRFLRMVDRQVGELTSPPNALSLSQTPDFQVVESLSVDDETFQPWLEAVEEEIATPILDLSELAKQPQRVPITFQPGHEVEIIRNRAGEPRGVIVRKRGAIQGEVEIAAQPEENELIKLTAIVLNQTPLEHPDTINRSEALLNSLVSTHLILAANQAEFVSLLDPPEKFRSAAAACSNIGTWPVMVGTEGERDMMLSSPIILYDYPQIAPESAGDLFDGTEIDEILSLRIMTLTDEEKREMRATDERARKILERTESLPVEQFMKMHGAVRGLKRVTSDE